MALQCLAAENGLGQIIPQVFVGGNICSRQGSNKASMFSQASGGRGTV